VWTGAFTSARRDGPARARIAPGLRAELGAGASEPLRIVATPGGAVAVRRRGASRSVGRLEGGSVVYEGVQPGVDAIVFSTHEGIEELVVAKHAGASIAYDLELPPGYRIHRSAVPGLVEIRDATSAARLRLWVKRAWDAQGHEVHVEPIVEGQSRVRVALDEAQVEAWPVVRRSFEPQLACSSERSQHGVEVRRLAHAHVDRALERGVAVLDHAREAPTTEHPNRTVEREPAAGTTIRRRRPRARRWGAEPRARTAPRAGTAFERADRRSARRGA
jgi:hypothetical protein